MPSLQTWKLRLTEVKWHSQDSAAKKWAVGIQIKVCESPEACLVTPTLRPPGGHPADITKRAAGLGFAGLHVPSEQRQTPWSPETFPSSTRQGPTNHRRWRAGGALFPRAPLF